MVTFFSSTSLISITASFTQPLNISDALVTLFNSIPFISIVSRLVQPLNKAFAVVASLALKPLSMIFSSFVAPLNIVFRSEPPVKSQSVISRSFKLPFILESIHLLRGRLVVHFCILSVSSLTQSLNISDVSAVPEALSFHSDISSDSRLLHPKNIHLISVTEERSQPDRSVCTRPVQYLNILLITCTVDSGKDERSTDLSEVQLSNRLFNVCIDFISNPVTLKSTIDEQFINILDALVTLFIFMPSSSMSVSMVQPLNIPLADVALAALKFFRLASSSCLQL